MCYCRTEETGHRAERKHYDWLTNSTETDWARVAQPFLNLGHKNILSHGQLVVDEHEQYRQEMSTPPHGVDRLFTISKPTTIIDFSHM